MDREFISPLFLGVSHPDKNWCLTPKRLGVSHVAALQSWHRQGHYYLRCYLAEDCFQARDDSPHEDDCITLDNDLFRARWVLERVPRIRSRTL